MRILVVASGGGHTGYAVALAQRLKGKPFVEELAFVVPKGDEWTKRKVSRYGEIVAETTKFMGPRTPLTVGIAKSLPALIEALMKVPRGFDVVVSTGSNHSVVVSLASKLKGSKLVSIESSVRFTRPSRAVRVLKHFAEVTVLQWPEQKKLVPEGVVVGPLYEVPEYEPYDGGYILITTGTYGFKRLFDVALSLSFDKVVLQTGRVDPEPYARARPEWKVFSFDPELGRWIAGAKVVVTHLGKTAIDAALSYGKPVVIVPNPEWSLHGASLEDAKHLAKKINAVLLEPERLSPRALEEAIEEASSRRPPRHPDGAENLARLLAELVEQA